MARRFFTLSEANALLPEVKTALASVRTAVASLERIRPGVTDSDGDIIRPDTDTRVDANHLRAVMMFHHGLAHIQSLDIEVKDVARGLIDFPARSGDREIRLCWLDGEESVAFFHDLETGFEGRKPIAEMPVIDDDDEDSGDS